MKGRCCYIGFLLFFAMQAGKCFGQNTTALKNLKLVTQTQLQENASCMAFSHNGRYLAVAGSGNKIIVWDNNTGLEAFVFEGHSRNVTSLSFSADDTVLLSGGGDNLVKTWDLHTGKLKKAYRFFGPSYMFADDARISQVEYHPSQDVFAAAGMDGKLILHRPDGWTSSFTIPVGDITCLKFNAQGDRLAVGGLSIGYIYLLRLNIDPQKPQISIEDTINVNQEKTIWSIDFINHDSLVYGSEGKITICDLRDHKTTIIPLKKGETAFKIKMCPGKELVAANINASVIRIWNYHTGQVIYEVTFRNPVSAFSKVLNESVLNAKDTTADPNEQINTTDSLTYALIKSRGIDPYEETKFGSIFNETGGFQDFAFDTRTNTLVRAEKGEVSFTDINSGIIKSIFPSPAAHSIMSLDFNQKGNILTFIYGTRTIKQFDFSTIKMVSSNDINSITPLVKVRSADDSTVIAMDATGNLIHLNVLTGKVSDSYNIENFEVGGKKVFMFSKTGRFFSTDRQLRNFVNIKSFPFLIDRFSLNTEHHLLAVYNSQYVVHEAKYVTHNSPHNYGRIEIWDYERLAMIDTIICNHDVNCLSISPDGRYVAYNEEYKPRERDMLHIDGKFVPEDTLFKEYVRDIKKNVVHLVEIGARRTTTFDGVEAGLTALTVSKDNKMLIAATKERKSFIWNIENNKLQYRLDDNAHYGVIIDLSEKNQLLASCDGDGGSIKLWDLKNGGNAFNLIPYEGGNFIISDRENHYFSTKTSVTNVAFRYKDNTYSFDQFDAVLNRPDLLLKTFPGYNTEVAGLLTDVYQKRISKLNLDPANIIDNRSPVAELNTTMTPSGDSVLIKLRLHSPYGILRSYNVWINDVPIFGISGIDLMKKQRKDFDQTFTVSLSTGDNIIEISAKNEFHLESLKRYIRITTSKKRQKPNLYLVAIGLSKYKNDEDSLTYPSKDAHDLVADFEAYNKENKVFNNVVAKTIPDEQADREHILDTLAFIKNADADDQVIIFLSGHGLVTGSTYNFCGHNFSQKEHIDLLSYDMIDSMLCTTLCRKKLLILNTCQSGEVDNNLRLFNEMQTYFTDLRRSSGTSVLSTAQGKSKQPETIGALEGVHNGLIVHIIRDLLSNGDAMPVSVFFQSIIDKIKSYKNMGGGMSIPDPVVRYQSINNDFMVF